MAADGYTKRQGSERESEKEWERMKEREVQYFCLDPSERSKFLIKCARKEILSGKLKSLSGNILKILLWQNLDLWWQF